MDLAIIFSEGWQRFWSRCRCRPDLDMLDLSIGQPMHRTPALLTETLAQNGHLWGRYPPVIGTADFREAVADWLTWRYDLPDGMIAPDRHVLPVAGTKEALFMLSQIVTPESKAGRQAGGADAQSLL